MLSFGCSVTIGETLHPVPGPLTKNWVITANFEIFIHTEAVHKNWRLEFCKSARVEITKHIFRLFGPDLYVLFSHDGCMRNAVMCCKSKTTLHTNDRRLCECKSHTCPRAAFSPHRRFTFICTICNLRFFFFCLSISRCSVFFQVFVICYTLCHLLDGSLSWNRAHFISCAGVNRGWDE